jgi:hypothetical protein
MRGMGALPPEASTRRPATVRRGRDSRRMREYYRTSVARISASPPYRFTLQATQIKTLTLVKAAAIAVFLGINSPAIADLIVVAPNSTTQPTLAIQLQGFNGSSPVRVLSSSASVNADRIRLDACILDAGFEVPGTYTINYSVANLTPGAYVIEYWRGDCNAPGVLVSPARLSAIALLTVMPNGSVALSEVTNYQGMWASPNQEGWGINLVHQGDILFASWFIYDANEMPFWVSMTATQQADGSFTGPIDQTSGPPFSALPYDPMQVTHKTVGMGRIIVAGGTFVRFEYTLNGSDYFNNLGRFVFAAPMPACTFNSDVPLAQAVNYTDMWAVPNLAEPGWGINFSHQGDVIFASWFIYDANSAPFWVSATLIKTVVRIYTGALDMTTGPSFGGPYNPQQVTHDTVGTATVVFADGDNATLTYTLNGVSRTKALTRFVFRAPGTVCH